MPIPSEGFPLSAAVSPRVHVIETVDSTNAKLLRDAADDPDGIRLAAARTRVEAATGDADELETAIRGWNPDAPAEA